MKKLGFAFLFSVIASNFAIASDWTCAAFDLDNPAKTDQKVTVRENKILPPISDEAEAPKDEHTFYNNRADLFISPSSFLGEKTGGASLRVFGSDGRLLGLTAVYIEPLWNSFTIDLKYFETTVLKTLRVSCDRI